MPITCLGHGGRRLRGCPAPGREKPRRLGGSPNGTGKKKLRALHLAKPHEHPRPDAAQPAKARRDPQLAAPPAPLSPSPAGRPAARRGSGSGRRNPLAGEGSGGARPGLCRGMRHRWAGSGGRAVSRARPPPRADTYRDNTARVFSLLLTRSPEIVAGAPRLPLDPDGGGGGGSKKKKKGEKRFFFLLYF